MKLDQGTEDHLKLVYPDIAERWRQVADEMDETHRLQIRITEGFRSLETQLEYWSRGREELPDGSWKVINPKLIITHSMPGHSMHHYGLAVDICFINQDPYPKDESVWSTYGTVLKKYGLQWGGLWFGSTNDRPHCEDKYGFTTPEIVAIYKRNKDVNELWDSIEARVIPKGPTQ